MEAPPPYMPPKKKTNTGLIVGIVIGAVLLCCITPMALLGGGIYWLFGKGKELVQCSSAFRDARDGMKMYADEHNGKLPPAETWQDDITTYYQKAVDRTNTEDRKVIPPMPANGVWGCADGAGGQSGIAFNDDVAGKELSKVETSNDIILFEIRRATRNAHEKYLPLPFSDAPKLIGKPRGWFLIRSSGPAVIISRGGIETNAPGTQ